MEYFVQSGDTKSKPKRTHRKYKHIHSQYEHWKRSSLVKTSPSATFGNSKRESPVKVEAPGPGAYNVELPLADKMMVSLKGSQMVRFNTESPGPNSYKPNYMFSSQKYTFPKGEGNKSQQMRPSPTSYHVESTKKHHFISFSKDERKMHDTRKSVEPGPGKYDNAQKKLQRHEFSFTKSKKYLEKEQECHEKKLIPGPGAYQLGKNRHKMQSYKFNHALRAFNNKQKTPGPGYYKGQISMLAKTGGIISKDKRDVDYSKQIPGPGKYQNISVELVRNREPTTKFGKAEERGLRVSTEVGPASYDKQVEYYRKLKGGVIGRGRRHSIPNSDTPGPVKYHPNFDQFLNHPKKTVFGKQQRLKNSSPKTPGPGYYQPQSRPKSMFGRAAPRHNKSQIEVKRLIDRQRKVSALDDE